MRWSKFTENLKTKISGLAETNGKTAYRDIFQDGVNITKEYKDMQTSKTIKPQSWLKQRNPLLLSFLNGVTGVTVDNSSEKILMRLLTSLSRFITPEILTSSRHFLSGKI